MALLEKDLMALTYDTKLRIPATARSTSTASPLSAAFTCGVNAEILVVMVMYAGITARTGGNPTYNNVSLTQVASRQGVTETSVELWYMLAPPVGASYFVSIPNANARTMWIYVVSGNAAAGYTCAFDASGVKATTGASPNVSITTFTSNTLIFAVVATGDNAFAPTARTGLSLYEEDIGNYGSAGQYYAKSSAGVQAISWTDTTSDDYGAIAVAFKEVAKSTPSPSVSPSVSPSESPSALPVASPGNFSSIKATKTEISITKDKVTYTVSRSNLPTITAAEEVKGIILNYFGFSDMPDLFIHINADNSIAIATGQDPITWTGGTG